MDDALNKYTFVPAQYKCILQIKELPPVAKCIYFYLACCAGKKGECHPKQETIAKDINISLRSVSNGIQLLEASRLITINKRWKLNRYRIAQPDHTQKTTGDHTQKTAGDNRKDETKKIRKETIANAIVEKKAKQEQCFDEKIRFDFSFDPKITQKNNPIPSIKQEAKKIDYHMTLQEAADFLTIMENGVTPNGRPIKNLGGLLRRWKEAQLPNVEDAAFEEEARLESRQDICFEYKDKTWTYKGGYQ